MTKTPTALKSQTCRPSETHRLNCPVPDFSTLCRRQNNLSVTIGVDDVTAPRRHRCARVGLRRSTEGSEVSFACPNRSVAVLSTV